MPTLSVGSLQLVFVFLVPGFVALKVYGLLVPIQRVKWGDTTIELLTYSMVNLGIMSPLILFLYEMGFQKSPVWYAVGTLVVLVISPAALAFFTHKLRLSEWVRKRLLHPYSSAWDHFFLQRNPCFILFHLKDGSMLGGLYGVRSFANLSPNEPDVYVEEVWDLDCNGKLSNKITDTAGAYVRLANCHAVEFFEAKEEEQ